MSNPRYILKHSFRFGDTVSLFEIKDDSAFENNRDYKGTFLIRNYSHLKFTCYKEGDEKFQNEVGFVIQANAFPNPNEITVWFGQENFVTVPYFCLNLEEKTSKNLIREPDLLQQLEMALLTYQLLAA